MDQEEPGPRSPVHAVVVHREDGTEEIYPNAWITVGRKTGLVHIYDAPISGAPRAVHPILDVIIQWRPPQRPPMPQPPP